MSEVFYREPDRCLHRALLNGVCTSCGAVQMMVVPVEIDYEAVKALPGREWYIDADTYIHAILDAAYGIGGDDE